MEMFSAPAAICHGQSDANHTRPHCKACHLLKKTLVELRASMLNKLQRYCAHRPPCGRPSPAVLRKDSSTRRNLL